MRLVITDTGTIWNKDNPFLEKYKDIVLVVCLNGKKVTDKYECFISPFDSDAFPEADSCEARNCRLETLASEASRLIDEFSYINENTFRDDIVFLTDNEPSTLYPYYVIKDFADYLNLNLVAISPLDFELKAKIMEYRMLTEDLSKLDTLLYYDTNQKLKEVDEGTKINEFFDSVRDELGNMMPRFLNGIYHIDEVPSFFDFSSMKYVPLKDGFYKIGVADKNKDVSEIDFPLTREYATLGKIYPADYPEEDDFTKETIERPVPRLDGKMICNILREQRLKLAKANNIPFESEECPSIGPCAGTCRKCDGEAAFLRAKMKKIPEGKRVYPQFDPAEEMTR